MALLTPQVITKAGLAPAFAAANSSDTVDVGNGGDRLVLHVKTGGTGTTVTLVDSGTTPGGSSATNPTVVIGTNTERLIYLPPSFANPSTGIATVNYSSTATVTAALYRL